MTESKPRPEDSLELTVLMPCLNEAETLEACIRKAQGCLKRMAVHGEVVVADNGSTDGSREIAGRLGARVVEVTDRGYGTALRGGIEAARGRYIIMADADDSYDFASLDPFLEKLRDGFDLVMGNRFRGGIAPGAMPPLHRYVGNPVLSSIGRLFFHNGIGDFHCGLRGFTRAAVERLDLRTTGMEFASEMVVKATLLGLQIAEVPTTLAKDGRSRPPHLRSWHDGWRHLRFLLMYSPRWLFLYPGLALMALCAGLITILFFGPIAIGGIQLDIHTMLFATAGVIVGFQAVLFAVHTKLFAINEGLLPRDQRFERVMKWLSLERGLALGGLLVVAGMAGTVSAVWSWGAANFGDLEPRITMRVAIASVLLLALGVQMGLSSFFRSILNLKRR